MSVFIAGASVAASAPSSGRGSRGLGDLGQELVVRPGRLDLVLQELEAGGGVAFGTEGVQHPAQLPDLLQLGAVEEELLVPGRTGVDVDRRVDAALGQLAVEAQL